MDALDPRGQPQWADLEVRRLPDRDFPSGICRDRRHHVVAGPTGPRGPSRQRPRRTGSGRVKAVLITRIGRMRLAGMEPWQTHGRRIRAPRRFGGARVAMLRGAAMITLLVVPLPTLAQDNVVATATLPRDLSPWGMYLNADPVVKAVLIDRKSTRLNSSHLGISYAVFCLK